MLAVNNIRFGFNGKEIIRVSDLEIVEGSFVSIIGPNGSGKSTLLKNMSRVLKPWEGTVYLENIPLKDLTTKMVAKKMAMLPQGPKGPGDLTVETIVSLGRFPHLKWRGILSKNDWDVTKWALKVCSLEGFTHRQLGSLSGGERQRVWIAQALAQTPKVLLLDEPTTFLDISHQLDTLDLIANLNKEHGITVIAVLHDINQAARYSDEIVAMKNGLIVAKGPVNELVNEEVIQEVFSVKCKVIIEEESPYIVIKGKA